MEDIKNNKWSSQDVIRRVCLVLEDSYVEHDIEVDLTGLERSLKSIPGLAPYFENGLIRVVKSLRDELNVQTLSLFHVVSRSQTHLS